MLRGIQRLARDMSFKVFRQEVIANNLANVTTPGFKTQRAFLSLLKDKISGGKAAGLEQQVVGTYTSFAQGPIENTHRALDLAIEGEGFFVIDTPYGERYTRCGSFTLTEAGFLATQTGDLVVGTGGPIAIRGQDLNITPDGKVIVDSEEVGSLRIVCFRNPQNLVREGNFFVAGGESCYDADLDHTQIIQGALERSNVSPIDEMVDMIALHRNFEAQQRSITLQDESAKKLIDRAGRLGRR